jgi:hypothetical protein
MSHPLPPDATTMTVRPDGRREPDQAVRASILSGSFNPLHEGHVRLAEAAADLAGLPKVFELPVTNADKGTLPAEEVERRLRQFAGRHTVVLTRLPLFTDKAAVFSGSVFAVGIDTARRLVDPRYYGGAAEMREALRAIDAAGCRFLVAGRVDRGRFRTLADVELPEEAEHLFEAIPAERFRMDISSTELREQGGDLGEGGPSGPQVGGDVGS